MQKVSLYFLFHFLCLQSLHAGNNLPEFPFPFRLETFSEITQLPSVQVVAGGKFVLCFTKKGVFYQTGVTTPQDLESGLKLLSPASNTDRIYILKVGPEVQATVFQSSVDWILWNGRVEFATIDHDGNARKGKIIINKKTQEVDVFYQCLRCKTPKLGLCVNRLTCTNCENNAGKDPREVKAKGRWKKHPRGKNFEDDASQDSF